nr:radical SAM protein [Candidatus Atribacteria bacterium]
YGINEIDMFDGLFSVNPNRVIKICKEIKRRKLKLRWSFRTRVDLVTEEMLGELKEAGCVRIYYGIESGDETILKNINKRVDIDMIKKVVSLTKQKGIDTFGYFMIGNPGENKDTIKKTIGLMLTLPLDYVQISPVFPPPNTALYKVLKRQTGKDYWAEYTLSPDKNNLPPRYGTKLTDKQIKKYVRECYLKFYLRCSYILKFIIKLRSWDEFARSAKALENMIFSFYFDN